MEWSHNESFAEILVPPQDIGHPGVLDGRLKLVVDNHRFSLVYHSTVEP